MLHTCSECLKLQKKLHFIIDSNNKYIPFINILQKYNIYDINVLEDKLKNIVIYNKTNIGSDENKNYKNQSEDNNDKKINIPIQSKHIEINDNIESKPSKIVSLENNIENVNNNNDNPENIVYDINNFKIKNASFNIIKSKVSDIILKRIIDLYNNNENKYKLPFGSNKKVNNVVNKINLAYVTLNKRKSRIIYNYYDLYNEYLKEKQKNVELKFNEYICYRVDNIKRYNEKVKRCYMLFNNLLNIVKDIKDYGKKKRGKEITIVNILGKCSLSIDKIYKIRNNNYNKLIEFLKPIIINECINDYNASLNIV